MMQLMPKVRTTLTIDEDVLRAVKVRGARTGKGDSEVIEEALRGVSWGSTCSSASGRATTI